MTARARHDQPTQRLMDPDETIVEGRNSRCRRSVWVVFVPDARQYLCPFCDAQLRLDRDKGGAS